MVMHGMACRAHRVRGTIGMQSREQLVAAMRQEYGYRGVAGTEVAHVCSTLRHSTFGKFIITCFVLNPLSTRLSSTHEKTATKRQHGQVYDFSWQGWMTPQGHDVGALTRQGQGSRSEWDDVPDVAYLLLLKYRIDQNVSVDESRCEMHSISIRRSMMAQYRGTALW